MDQGNQSVLEVEHQGGVLSLTLNRPDQANALNSDLVEALIRVLSETDDLRLCVIKGHGKNFCAGFDLADLDDLSEGDLLWRFLRIETLLQLIYHAPFAVVAMAQGQVIGAGADLFAACWRRLATADTKFRMPGWNFELALGTQRLTDLIGADAARDLLIDSKTLSADEGLTCGLVTALSSQHQWSAELAQLQRRSAVLSTSALAQLFTLTRRDTRATDMAAIIATAGCPGLKARIIAYRDTVKFAHSKRSV